MSIEDITNPLEYIECIIAFDVRDWCGDSRLSAIYAIVFGFDDEGYCELQKKYHWSDIVIKRLKEFHKEWERLRPERRKEQEDEMLDIPKPEHIPEAPPRLWDFEVGQYIIYRNNERYEIGRVKEITKDGAFVSYTEGSGSSLTLFSDMHPLVNDYCIEKTTLGGNFFGSREK